MHAMKFKQAGWTGLGALIILGCASADPALPPPLGQKVFVPGGGNAGAIEVSRGKSLHLRSHHRLAVFIRDGAGDHAAGLQTEDEVAHVPAGVESENPVVSLLTRSCVSPIGPHRRGPNQVSSGNDLMKREPPRNVGQVTRRLPALT